MDAIRAGCSAHEIKALLDAYDEIIARDHEEKLHAWDDDLGELATAAEDLLTGTRSRDKVNRVRDALTALDPFYEEH